MNKLLTVAAAALAAVWLSGCSDGTATVIYEEEPSPLTKMTFDTALPPETYSEYMATYTPTETTESNDERFYRRYGVQADTGVTSPERVTADSGQTTLLRDTSPARSLGQGMVRDTAVTSVTTAPTESGESGTETCVTGSETGSETEVTTTATTLARPRADTLGGGKISADTAPTSFVPETTSDTTESSDE